MKKQTLFCLLSCLIFSTPSVLAQRKSYTKTSDCRQVLSLDIGSHLFANNGQVGANLGVHIENIIQNHFTFNIGLKEFANKSGIFTYDFKNNPVKEFVEHRLTLATGVNFYPKNALRGLYLGLGLGGLIKINGEGDAPIQYKNGMPELSSSIELLSDGKIGYQGITKSAFTWNIYGGVGLFIPRNRTPNPIFELGIKLGKKM